MGNTCSVDSFENVFTGLINWLGEILTKVKDRIVKFTRTIFQTIRDAVLYAFEIQELRQKRAEAASTVYFSSLVFLCACRPYFLWLLAPLGGKVDE